MLLASRNIVWPFRDRFTSIVMTMLWIPAFAGMTVSSAVMTGVTKAWADSNLIERIQQSEKSMVTVRTEMTRTMPTIPPRQATFYRNAAGIVIDPSGIIVTNTHTIVDAPFIFVILRDGTKLPARRIYTSPDYDFSFLRVYPPHPLKRIRWANSVRVHIGNGIIAIGNSENSNRMMAGHIKNILQSHPRSGHEFLELDLDLFHGDSGGPILDGQGRLLGMIMAKRTSQQNSSIAIASNKIHEQYLHYKENMP